MARELGLFEKHGLRVELSREIGWAAVRDKIAHGHLDAAQAVIGLPLAMTLGLGGPPIPCVTGLVLNLQGNAITLSNELWELGVRDAKSLRSVISRFRGTRTLTIGVVSSVSSHHFLLRRWVTLGGIDPDNDVRLVVVPPSQVLDSLRAKNLDGFCAGEPWNSLAVAARVGWIATLGSEIFPRHPEKVLLAQREFAEQRAAEYQALIAALLEACEYCQAPENHAHVISVVAGPRCLNRPAECLRPSFSGVFDIGHGRALSTRDFLIFSGSDVNEPCAAKGAWALNELRGCGLLPDPVRHAAQVISSVFRYDIYQTAKSLLSAPDLEPHENPHAALTPCH